MASFQSLTIDFMIIYGRMHSDSTPSLVMGSRCAVDRSCDCDAYWSDLQPPFVLNVLMLVHVQGYIWNGLEVLMISWNGRRR